MYRERRKVIVENGAAFMFGQQIPRVKYSDAELATWGVVYRKIKEMTTKYAVRQVCRQWILDTGYALLAKLPWACSNPSATIVRAFSDMRMPWCDVMACPCAVRVHHASHGRKLRLQRVEYPSAARHFRLPTVVHRFASSTSVS